MLNIHQTLGHVAATQPASTMVFLRHRLDFCCKGGQKLVDACRAAGLEPDAIIAEIEAESGRGTPVRWDEQPLGELIDFIITRYHDSLRADLPALLAAATRVERVHAAKASCPHGLAKELEAFERDLSQHLLKEERALFPAIRSGAGGDVISAPTSVMMQEHEDHGAVLERLRTLTGDYDPPLEACATWRALYAGLATLERELMEHIHLENNVLFPRALNV